MERGSVRKLELVTARSDQRGMGIRISSLLLPMLQSKPRLAVCWAGLLVFALGSGCQVPRYQFPAGYSSTYSRHLQREIWDTPLPPDTPPVDRLSDAPGVFYPQTFDYQPPTRSEIPRTAVVLPEDRPVGRRRY